MATKIAAAKKPAAKTKIAPAKPAAKASAPKAKASAANAATKTSAAKGAPAKPVAGKRIAAKAAPKLAAVSKPVPKPAPKPGAVSKAAAKPSAKPAPVKLAAAKPVNPAPAKPAAAPQPPKPAAAKAPAAKAAPLAVKAVEVKKIAGLKAASQGKGAAFDADKRRELIAAAAARHNKAAPAKFAGPRIDPIRVRPPEPVERHRFAIGDSVKVVSTSGMWFKHGVAYRVTAALPPAAGGKLQYRIKNDQEPFERVVSESQLASL